MTKRYSILQKKLEELESILYQLLCVPSEAPVNHQLYSQDIEQRFVFVRKLLSAEFASHPRNPNHLQHVARRLAKLETVFKEWDSIKALTVVGHIEPGSTCSCTESCLNEDDEGEGNVSPGFEGSVEEEEENVGTIEERDIGTNKDNASEKAMKRGWVIGKNIWIMSVGIVVGMALMGLVMASASDCFRGVKRNNFLPTPT